MRKERVRVVVKEPEMHPRLVEIPLHQDTFEFAQKFVAAPFRDIGYVEPVRFNDRVTMFVNEDGRALGLPINFLFEDSFIVGKVVFCCNRTNGMVDMQDKDIADVLKFFSTFQGLKKTDDSHMRCFFCHELLDATEHDCKAKRRK